MHPVRLAPELYRQTRKRVAYLQTLLPPGPVTVNRHWDRTVSFVAIEAMNCWASYSRALYLSTCRGALTPQGKRLATKASLYKHDDALRFACVRFKPSLKNYSGPWTHREEPNWLDPNTLLILLQDAGASNAGDVGAALSFQGRVLQDLPSLRNFFAHRAQNTAEKASRKMLGYGLSPRLHPSTFCLSYESGSSRSVLFNWLSELDLVQELAVS